MFEMESRIRYSELDSDGKLELSELLDYFQDCANFQSEDLGAGYRKLLAEQKAWFLCFWQVVIDRYPRFGERIRVQTFPYSYNRIFAKRNFRMLDERGEELARANSVWFVFDFESGRPLADCGDYVKVYPMDESVWEDAAPGRRIRIPKELQLVPQQPALVGKTLLDTNVHVNNAKYVTLAEDFFPVDREVREIRIEYREAAKLGDLVTPAVGTDGEWTYISLMKNEEDPYAVIAVR